MIWLLFAGIVITAVVAFLTTWMWETIHREIAEAKTQSDRAWMANAEKWNRTT